MTPFGLAEPATFKEAIGLLDDSAVRPIAGIVIMVIRMLNAGRW